SEESGGGSGAGTSGPWRDSQNRTERHRDFHRSRSRASGAFRPRSRQRRQRHRGTRLSDTADHGSQ
ncbi:MAG: hypothetical protein J2P31_12390, partial [Blastocatellia bacterium]|nr:hypothetical protein [Blastocatellia bacterium]